MTIWQPGMRCVCIAIHPSPPMFADARSGVIGQVYTVRNVGPCEIEGETLLWLDEIDNSHLVGRIFSTGCGCYRIGGEPGLEASLFRPLCEGRLDQFRKHLDRIPSDLVPA